MSEQQILTDARPDVLGMSLSLDAERFNDAKAACGMSPEQTVIIKLVPVPDSDIKGQTATSVGVKYNPETPQKPPTLLVPVQDRLEFTDKAVSRINRSVVMGLRMLAGELLFLGFYPEPVAKAFLTHGGSLLMSEGYEFARNYVVDRPDRYILTPVVAADDSNDTANDNTEDDE